MILTVFTLASCSRSAPDAASATKSTIAGIKSACAAYKADCSALPSEAGGVRALIDNPGATEWHGPYLRGDVPVDAWGKEFRYRISNDKPVVESAGPDGTFGTPDDLH